MQTYLAEASLDDVMLQTAGEESRLADDVDNPSLKWKLWGPYLSERQWGTVREDYSQDGNCWEYFPHDAAIYRAYQWGEDGLFGFSDDKAGLCMGLALWNGKDAFLKERLFGLTGPQGNHGEDVKECYFYLDSTPTHSYCKSLYKYPQQAFPYDQLLNENTIRGLDDPEYELLDTGVFDSGAYWDVFVDYAKASSTDILCQYTIHNRGNNEASLHVMPQVWFRNTWSWGENAVQKPYIVAKGASAATCHSNDLGEYTFKADKSSSGDPPVFLFTENDSNPLKLRTEKSAKEEPTSTGFYKDAFNEYIVNGNQSVVNSELKGTKIGAYYKLTVAAQSSVTMRCRLANEAQANDFGKAFDNILNQRKLECSHFYDKVIPSSLLAKEKMVARQAYAGLCFTKQFFYYHIADWAKGRTKALNAEWKHMLNHDVISMPDKWEFPWYATWDLAFHMVPFCNIDPEFAKQQLLLFLDDRYLHPNGQLPAYEFNFSDVNPPVHAWACFKVYETAANIQGRKDTDFLKKVFHKLLLNFNWWVNKKDRDGRHIFHGGFLGMDNISCVHRSEPPEGTSLDQVDGTAWMAFFSVCMLKIATELSYSDPVYEDMAIRFFKHFVLIKDAINNIANGMWDPVDGFYYDLLKDGAEDKTRILRVRSLVGLSTMFSAYVVPSDVHEKLPKLYQAMKEVFDTSSTKRDSEKEGRCFLTVPNKKQVESMLSYMLNDKEFLSPHGIRSLSKYHKESPVSVEIDDETHSVSYCPGESNSDMFGGNSNWRGPVWICMNYLLLEALDTYDDFYGNSFKVEYPLSSGSRVSLRDVANDIRRRIVSIFLADNAGKRPVNGDTLVYSSDPNWKDLILFYEYFHGDSGRGCGASHQTGWTALVACILNKLAK